MNIVEFVETGEQDFLTWLSEVFVATPDRKFDVAKGTFSAENCCPLASWLTDRGYTKGHIDTGSVRDLNADVSHNCPDWACATQLSLFSLYPSILSAEQVYNDLVSNRSNLIHTEETD